MSDWGCSRIGIVASRPLAEVVGSHIPKEGGNGCPLIIAGETVWGVGRSDVLPCLSAKGKRMIPSNPGYVVCRLIGILTPELGAS
jgi:hypothetical protein